MFGGWFVSELDRGGDDVVREFLLGTIVLIILRTPDSSLSWSRRDYDVIRYPVVWGGLLYQKDACSALQG